MLGTGYAMPSAITTRRVDKLISLLVRNGTVVVPGPKIASEIGVTRARVFEWIEQLRAYGLEIDGVPAKGYRLVKIPDVLVPSLVREELGNLNIGHHFVHYFQTGSTNDAALQLAANGAEHGTVVVAEEQTSGRGRLGRTWHSERSSGIYTSIILRPPMSPAAAPVLTLMAGLAAQQAVSAHVGLPVDIRWPNDLLINGKKVCGILTEMSAELDRLHFVVLGIGINVNNSELPVELKGIASSLRIEAGRVISRLQVLVSLLRELDRNYQLLLKDGAAAIVKQWAAASSFASGKRVRVVRTTGEMLATTAGLESSGGLRIRSDEGREESLVAGEVVEVK